MSHKKISPKAALEQIARAIPEDCRKNLVIIGSLAAGYHYFGNDANMQVRTKDADCLISPRVEAVETGIKVTNQLMKARWTYHPTEEFPEPGTAETPEEKLPVVRLKPPTAQEWFVELLTVPASPNDIGRKFVRLATSHGHFSMCSFGFLRLTDFKPIETNFGIRVARPEMMALANMLHHPRIGGEVMTGLYDNRSIKRSNKDLGRVLGLAYLAEKKEPGVLEEWASYWMEALQDRFPDHGRAYAKVAGHGVRELLAASNPHDFDEAYHTCVYGLLASSPPTSAQLRTAAERLLNDAIEPLATLADR